MIGKVENFIKRIRWKAFFYDNEDQRNNNNNSNFGFKSDKTPPQNEHLNAFEDDLYEMIRSIEFRRTRNAFQKQLSEDIKKVKESNEIQFMFPPTKLQTCISYLSIITRKYSPKISQSPYKKSDASIVRK